jgi:hypothetical protein
MGRPSVRGLVWIGIRWAASSDRGVRRERDRANERVVRLDAKEAEDNVVGRGVPCRLVPPVDRVTRDDDLLLVLGHEELLSSSCPPSFGLWPDTRW